jgi:uncharacterized protein
MNIAVIGAGIAGIAAADALQAQANVTLFEAARRIGGHTDTHAILSGSRTYRVDSGFIVFNEENYPAFSGWLRELGIPSRPADMSFGVSHLGTGLEYGTRSFNALFCQRRNAASPRFLGMLRDLRRFYRRAPLIAADDPRTLGAFLAEEGYGDGFAHDHLLPMCAALWSLPATGALQVPVAHVVAFMAHHRMLQLGGRPLWRVVDGGSGRYLEAFSRRFRGRIRPGDAVQGVTRRPHEVEITATSGRHRFDAVVLACHSDQALALLRDPSAAERQVLGAIAYQPNRVVVHSDPSVMPRRRLAWSSWNAVVDPKRGNVCQVTYWMNRLQSLSGDQPFFVTLNPSRRLHQVWSEREYAHPVFTPEARRAQARRPEISGQRNTWYCGAYWGWGFHEDGFVSGRQVAVEMQAGRSRAA